MIYMQEIVTILVLTLAFSYGFYSLFKVIFPKKQKPQLGCSSGCNCDAVKIRKELLVNKKTTG